VRRNRPQFVAYRWFCRLDIEDTVPDHSTFSKNRHGRFGESDAFRHVFESVVERGMKEGLVGGEALPSQLATSIRRSLGFPGELDTAHGMGGQHGLQAPIGIGMRREGLRQHQVRRHFFE
jgi:hypothetical protein